MTDEPAPPPSDIEVEIEIGIIPDSAGPDPDLDQDRADDEGDDLHLDVDPESDRADRGIPVTVTGIDNDREMADRPTHLSPSSAASFEQCRRRWRFKYLDRRPEPSGQAALVGTFAHRVLELLCGLPASFRTLEQAKALAKEVWPEFAQDPDFVALALDESAGRAFRWQAWLAINGLWKLEDPSSIEIVSTEQKVTVELGAVPFVGVIDRVDRSADKLVITDYKSGTLPRMRFRGDKIQQVMLYAAALARSGGEQPERARLLYLGQRIIEVGVTERRLEEAEARLTETWNQVVEALTRDVFEPNPGVLCGWCPFVAECPEGREELARRAREGTLPQHAPAATLVA